MIKIKKLVTRKRQYYFIVFLRIISPFLIFKIPLAAVIIVTFLDIIDAEFASRKLLTVHQYQIADKSLDTWWYLIAMVFSLFFLKEYSLFLMVLLVYRLMGVLFLHREKDRKKLVFFPNFFENAFFLFFFSTYFKSLNFLIEGRNLYYSLLVVFILKLIQEYWIHVAKISIREDIFKYKRDWLDNYA